MWCRWQAGCEEDISDVVCGVDGRRGCDGDISDVVCDVDSKWGVMEI